MEYSEEIWKPVVFEDVDFGEKKYELSSFGRIRRWDPKKGEWKMINPPQVKGYPVYTFWGKNNRKTILIHRLVAKMFLKKEHALQKYVIHLDFRKDNNRIDNLKWVTRETMVAHMRINPNWITKRKGKITNAKLTESQVIRLKKKIKRGKNPLYKIAREFGITHTQLNRIRRGENWGHVKIDDEDEE
ncbi:MAG: NUMOD4 domain-containing protein [Bacteroidales bacterium]